MNSEPSTSTPMPSKVPNVNGVKPQGQKRKYTLPPVGAPQPDTKAQMKLDLATARTDLKCKNDQVQELEKKNGRMEREVMTAKSVLSLKDNRIKDLEKELKKQAKVYEDTIKELREENDDLKSLIYDGGEPVSKKKCTDPKVQPMEAQLEGGKLEEVATVNERLVKEEKEKDERIRELEARSQDQDMDTIEEDVIDDWNPEDVHGDVPEEPEELAEDLRRWSPIESEFAEEASTPRIQNHPTATVDQIHEIWAAINKFQKEKAADRAMIQNLKQNFEGLQQKGLKVPDAAAFDGLQEEIGIKDRKITRLEDEIESLKREKRETAEKIGGLTTEVELLRAENEGKGSSLLEQRIRLLEGELAASKAEAQKVGNAWSQMAEDDCVIIQRMHSKYTKLVMLRQGQVAASGLTISDQSDEAGTSK